MDGWVDVGSVEEIAAQGGVEVRVGSRPVAVSVCDGVAGAVSGTCNHAAGPLGQGSLDGDYVVCPWHHWKFHRVTGEGEPGFEEDRVPRHEVRVENGRVLVAAEPSTRRSRKPHEPHPLAREIVREPGPTRVVGISATAMDRRFPRFSTSEALLAEALARAAEGGCETRTIRLDSLRFRACEGYYSKAAGACTWPCSITQMDRADELTEVYEALVHWADVVLVATPIRWGAAGSLYFRMAERLNCIQNQVTIHNRVLIRNKVAAFVITGGQDNIQAVAGQMLTFFSELGFLFPQFPFIAHSRGWSAEDMENNVAMVRESEELKEGARDLMDRSLALAHELLAAEARTRMPRGGRKGHHLER
ncbi:MAG: NAD(P)H-dependent oxidoreductase [Thermoanaerobaculia bacterium]